MDINNLVASNSDCTINKCSNNGKCDESSNKCECNSGYFMKDCSVNS